MSSGNRSGNAGCDLPTSSGVANHSIGRFCRSTPPPTCCTHRDPSGFQICPCCFSTHTRSLLDAPKRPAELSERDYLLFLFFIQDIAHADGAYPPVGMSRTLALSLAGFG